MDTWYLYYIGTYHGKLKTCQYTNPVPGGSFHFDSICLKKYRFLCEFISIKPITALIIDSLQVQIMKKETFKEIIETDNSILLLDIREPEELLIEETIPGAKNVPMGKVFTEAIKGNLPKDVQIIVFCRTGGRAGVVERELRERGYLIDGLEGGLEALRET